VEERSIDGLNFRCESTKVIFVGRLHEVCS